MSPEQQVIHDIVRSVTPELWYFLIQSMATVAIGLAVYKGLNALVAYCFVRFDKELGKNVGVIVNGHKGYIAHINLRHLIVKFDENDSNNGLHSGNDLLIPITQVASREWEIIRRRD
jgi:hypothetical protein